MLYLSSGSEAVGREGAGSTVICLKAAYLSEEEDDDAPDTGISIGGALLWDWEGARQEKLPPVSPWKSAKETSPDPALGASWKSWKSSSSGLAS